MEYLNLLLSRGSVGCFIFLMSYALLSVASSEPIMLIYIERKKERNQKKYSVCTYP
jgi:hypothetical protein